MPEAPILTAAIRRDRLIVVAALSLACTLAWIWLAQSPGGDNPMAAMPGMGPPALSFGYWLGAFVMWSLMMVAMMLPSAAPMILLYAGVAGRTRSGGLAPTGLFAGVYVLAWTAFSALAALVQGLLASTGAVEATRLSIGDHRIAGALLIFAGVYQLTPLKGACLVQCQSPTAFVMRYWRPGWRGALSLGLRHAAACLGCCWALMALLFVGGVMNLPWVAFLAAVVLAEKLAPIGRRGAWAIAAVATAVGVAVFAGLPVPFLR